jgi:hypothetical protein
MQSVAAYYVLVATDLLADQRAANRRFDVPAPRRSLVARLGLALECLTRRGGRSAAQPA